MRCDKAWVLLLLAAMMVGCGDGRPTRYKVSGKVLIDGQPMRFGIVQVTPEGMRPASGLIKEDGTFTLGSYELDDGCVAGTHKVAINGKEPLGSTKIRWHAPPNYQFASNTGITLTVEDDMDDWVIEIDTGAQKAFTPFVQVLARGMSEEQVKRGDSVF